MLSGTADALAGQCDSAEHRAATYAYHELMARLYITPVLGSKWPDRIQTRDVPEWLDELARTCQCCAQGKDAKRPENKRRWCARYRT